MTPLRTLWLGALALPLVSLAQDSRTFDSAGVSLRYLETGDGPTVLLLHGFSGSAEGLYVAPGTVASLADAGYRVIALDQRGHGKSDKPHDPESYGLEMVENVRRLLDHLAIDRVHLVGYSMGGKVAATFRVHHPERLLSITLGGYGWPWRSGEVTLAEARQRLASRTVLPGNDLEALAAVSTGMHRLTPAEDALRSNQVPALAIIGDRDEVVPRSDYDTLVATMPMTTSVIIPGTHAGEDGAPYKPVFAQEVLAFLVEHGLFGADLLEVGYRDRGGHPLEDHLWVWDRLADAGLRPVGIGVSDSHGGVGSWSSDPHNFVPWIFAAQPARGADGGRERCAERRIDRPGGLW